MSPFEYIAKIDLLALLEQEAEAVDSGDWGRFGVPPFYAYLVRVPATGEEPVWVVAKHGRRVIFFDDVEEEFAVGTMSDDGAISDVALVGHLAWAMRVLCDER